MFKFLLSTFLFHKLIKPISLPASNNPKVALTFDADMTQGMVHELESGKIKTWYNSKIIEILNKNEVPATIFFSGLWVKTYPEISQSLAKNPLIEVANHSYDHPGFTKNCFGLPMVADKNYEFTESQKVISQITKVTPKYFRFPGGCHSPTDIKLANKYGLTVVDWDVASGDAFNNSEQSIIDHVEKNVKDGSIVVFHLHGNRNAPKTAEALEPIIKNLKLKNYRFVKVSDIIGRG